jgi:hypothetical protein
MLDFFTEKTNRRRLAGPLLLLLIVAVAFAPVDIPYTIESMAKVLPAREWVLTKDQNGFLSVTLHDHLLGIMKSSDDYQFERGDFVSVTFFDTIGYVEAAAPLARITSNRLEEQLVNLRTELSIELSNLGVVATGEKDPLLDQLREEVNLARERLRLQVQQYERTQLLFADSVASLADMERAENGLQQARLQVEVAERAYEVGATGEKEETVTLVNTRISALRERIDFLESRRRLFDLKAPFSGRVYMEKTLTADRLVLADTSASILVIPVRKRDSRYVHAGQPIQFELADHDGRLEGRVLSVGTEIGVLDREPVVTVRALASANDLPTGMPLRCMIRCDSVRVAEFLNRSIQW